MISYLSWLVISFLCLVSFSAAQEDHGVSTDVNTLKFNYFGSDNSPVEITYGNLDSLNASKFLHSRPTTLIIDGFLSTYPSNMSLAMTKSLENCHRFETENAIVLDWGSMSGGRSPLLGGNLTQAMATLYPLAVANISPVGQRVAQFLDFLRVNGHINWNMVHIVGHSLGSHIAGMAGKYATSQYSSIIGRITGLDPANTAGLPLPLVIQKLDADLVDLYYTNSGGMGDTRTDAGDLIVYVNGGNNQPVCPEEELVPGYCSHSYSWRFYSDTISVKQSGCPCSTTTPGNAPSCFCKTSCDDACSVGPASLGYILTPGVKGLYHVTVKEVSGKGEVLKPGLYQAQIFVIVMGMLLHKIMKSYPCQPSECHSGSVVLYTHRKLVLNHYRLEYIYILTGITDQ
ncbi:pancreatic triacylglycerol lipase isoform X2 [Folsomia candida]|uniref:pancreatic triacylglycerol lipase isoform X2 n=1 Tax=Folsomia candida TaxID=158441 RepID=UPI000B8FBF6E|nr:pancreatic triacylglycerol lipase isoform X2 [Folsomia candida]